MSTLTVGNQTINSSNMNTIGQTFNVMNVATEGAFATMFFGTIFLILYLRTAKYGTISSITASSLALVVISFYFYLQNFIPFTYPLFFAAIVGISGTILFTENK